jgi:cysteinyl-tRNA synthetase
MLKLYNTLTKKTEEFRPIHPPVVGLYTCGMTVYDHAHIGHGKKYVGDDILRRALMRLGYEVKHVQNVTDVGHLSSDADSGEDKMEKGAQKSGKTVWEIARYYTDHFYRTMDLLGVLRPNIICKATEHIPEQVALVAKLIKKGYAYDTPEAVYFDISKFPAYGQLFGQNLIDKKTAIRQEVQTGKYKRNPIDFVLWFKRVGRFADHVMHWDSPWGDGFPGWHIECSAMSMKYLGDTVDIHTGGIDHIPVHHPNEIAQSEAVTGKQFVRFWIHHAFLVIDGQKMSKSLGNYYTIEDLVNKGFDPLTLRYFYLTAHYRKPLNFTWEALKGAQNALTDLRQRFSQLAVSDSSQPLSVAAMNYKKSFDEGIYSDLNTPIGLRVVWEVMKSQLSDYEKRILLEDFDQVLGIGLKKSITDNPDVPPAITQLAKKRQQLRKENKFVEADVLRKQIDLQGYVLEDTPQGVVVKKKSI